MKITKLLLIVVAALAFACSKDDETPALEKQTLSLAGNAEVIAAPAAMQSSDDPNAQAAAQTIAEIGNMSEYLSLLKPPAGAAKSSDRITPANGRVNATGDVVVYIWEDEQFGKIGYQISETSDSYVFEVFMMYTGQTQWLRYFHAEEKKDKSQGFLKVYDIWGFTSEDPSTLLLSYNWSLSGDTLTFTMTDHIDNSTAKVIFNQKTKAGSIVITVQGVKDYEMFWDAAGNGSWVDYDEEGNAIDEGSWTV
jgi:hypothetical protein